LPSLTADSNFADVDERLDKLTPQSLNNLLWSNNGYKPEVRFKIGHSGQCIYLRYDVSEDDMRATHNATNDLVFEDTCVEFFISIGNDRRYYNIEFNCFGTCFMGYARDKNDIDLIPPQVIGKIKSQTKIRRVEENFKYNWQLTLIIPTEVFIHHPGINLNGLNCRANFYKCGDKLNKPHFLSWSNIESEQPNFHQPDFFGQLYFEA